MLVEPLEIQVDRGLQAFQEVLVFPEGMVLLVFLDSQVPKVLPAFQVKMDLLGKVEIQAIKGILVSTETLELKVFQADLDLLEE